MLLYHFLLRGFRYLRQIYEYLSPPLDLYIQKFRDLLYFAVLTIIDDTQVGISAYRLVVVSQSYHCFHTFCCKCRYAEVGHGRVFIIVNYIIILV